MPGGPFMNIVAPTFTPTSGSAVVLGKVTRMSIDEGVNLIPFSGDADIGPTTIVPSLISPSVMFAGANYPAFHSIAPGTTGVISGSVDDAKLKHIVTSGGLTLNIANAVRGTANFNLPHAQYADAGCSFALYYTDTIPQTSPLAFTIL